MADRDCWRASQPNDPAEVEVRRRKPPPGPPPLRGRGRPPSPFGGGIRAMLTILFDGIAYGMLLFVLACGLAVTLGLMNFVNLAHGAFAMVGGYITLVLVNRAGLPFFAGLPIAFLI